MPAIISIQYKDTLVRIELDTGEKFDLPPEIMGLHRLAAGVEIGKEEYRQLKDESEKFTCWRKSLQYLSIRNRSSSEVELYLKKKGYSAEAINITIARHREYGYIDDVEFARRFSASRAQKKNTGKNVIRRDLLRKGISKKIIDKAIRETGADQVDMDALYDAAVKKYHSYSNKKNGLQRIYRFLIYRGFDNDSVMKIIRRMKEDGLE